MHGGPAKHRSYRAHLSYSKGGVREEYNPHCVDALSRGYPFKQLARPRQFYPQHGELLTEPAMADRAMVSSPTAPGSMNVSIRSAFSSSLRSLSRSAGSTTTYWPLAYSYP